MREPLVIERTIKVLRTKYKLRVWDGMAAGGLASCAASMPANAKLVEYRDADDGDTYLVFEAEETE